MPYWFDGNNLIGLSAAAAKADAGARKAFLSTLSSLHRSGGGKFLVYFDGDDPDRARMPPGVAVRYSAPLSTDDAMVRRLREIQHPAEVIVVTNDRAADGADAEQGRQGDGPGRNSWRRCSPRAAPATRGRARQEKPVDVDEWIEFFGLEKTKI